MLCNLNFGILYLRSEFTPRACFRRASLAEEQTEIWTLNEEQTLIIKI